MDWLTILIVLALLATVVSLLLGLTSMGQGGRFGQRFGNLFMWLRVGLQGVAVLLLILVWYMNR